MNISASQYFGSEPQQRERLPGPKEIFQGQNEPSTEYNHTIGYVFETESDAPSIAKLPTEVLMLVFEQVHEGQFPAFSHTLSSVCRYWRYLAIGTPSLWSPIIFAEDEDPGNLDRVRLYLERSKGFPVEISVHCGMDNVLGDFCDDLIPHLSHCRSLSIEGNGQSLYSDIERLGSSETPLLENLVLTNGLSVTDGPGGNRWFPPPQRKLFSSSNLHTVRMDMIELDLVDATRYFDLGTVRKFWLTWQFRILDDLVEWQPEDATIETFVSHVVETMPELRELALACIDAPLNASIVPILHTLPPSLTSLDIYGVSIAWNLKYGNWWRRDFASLQNLRLSFHAASSSIPADLFTLLGITPNLKELYVGHVDLLPHSRQATQRIYLTRLEGLTLERVGKRMIDEFLQILAAPALNKVMLIAAPNTAFDVDSEEPGPDAVIADFWRSCTQVESITLGRCTLSRNVDLLEALRNLLTKVKNLDLRGSSRWNDELLRGLGSSPWPCPFLESVSFSYIPELTQDALESFLRARKRGFLANECAEITRIGMRGCPRLRVTETLGDLVKDVWHWI